MRDFIARRFMAASCRFFNQAKIKVRGGNSIFNAAPRSLFILTTVLAVAFLFFGFLFLAKPAGAIVSTAASDNTGGALRLKQSSAFFSVISIQFGSNENLENLNAIAVTFTGTGGSPVWTNGAATASELLDLATTNGGVSLWKETSGAGFSSAADTQVTLAATPVYGASGVFVITPASSPALATDEVYYVVIKSDTAGVTNNNAFTVTLPTNGITTSVSSPVLGANVTTAVITIDTAAPTAIADGQAGAGGPPNTQTGVPIDAWIDRGFSETLTAGSATTANVSLQTNTGNTQAGAPTGANLCTAVSLNGNTNLRCDHGALTPSTWYTVTFGTGITDTATNALAAAFTRVFQTGSNTGTNTTPPMVTGSVPMPGQQGVPTNAKLRIYFPAGPAGDMAEDSASGSVESITNVQLFLALNGQPTGSNLLACATVNSDCNLSWTSATRELIVTPGKKAPAGTVTSTGGTALAASTSYILQIQGTAKNTANQPIMPYFLPFQTGAGADTTGPGVAATYPANSATGISPNIGDVMVSFNEAVDPATITTSTVLLIPDTNGNASSDDSVLGTATVSYSSNERSAHITVGALLATNKLHFIKIVSGGSGVKDIAGNAMAANVVYSFTTAVSFSDSTAPTVTYARADNFQVAISFSEPMKTGGGTNAVDNLANFTMESPTGVTVNLTGKTISYDSTTMTTTISGLALGDANSFRVTVATAAQDLSGNAISTSGTPAANVANGTVSAAVSGGMMGPGAGTGQIDYYSMGTSPVRVMPRTALAGATSNYEVEFMATQAINSGGKIMVTFPNGFSFSGVAPTCGAPAATVSFANADINGPMGAGTITIASVTCDSVARTISIVTAGGNISANDMVRVDLQGIINSSVPKDFNTSGYTADIKTFAPTTNALLESKTSMPFFISTPGSYLISGTIFNDSGAGGGTANNGTKDGAEPGIANIKVCMGSPMGFSCATTDADGAYSFTQLNNGFYHIDIPPLTTGSFVGGPFYRDVNVSGANVTGVNFAFRTAAKTISVNITGGPANTKVDIFSFNPTNMTGGGSIVREATLDGSGATASAVSLPISDGTWDVGVGPWMPKDPSLGPSSPPEFTFMPPPPQQVIVSGSGPFTVNFVLRSSNRSIIGKVIDGSGSGIANAFVMARPTTAFDASGDKMTMQGGVGMTKADGTFTLKVVNGVYLIDAAMPGMPPTSPQEVTVKNNVSTTDGNNDGTYGADVYQNGTLLTGTGLTLRIAKGALSIAGRVLDESGNAISYAHVEAEKVNDSGSPIGGWTGGPTDSTGNYTLYVDNGTWRMRAFSPGFGEMPSMTVVVSGSNLTGQNFQASTADFGTVTGQVTQGGTPVTGAFVGIHGPNGGNMTTTNGSGNYTIKVKAGTGYIIDGFVPGSGPLTPLTGVTVTANATLPDQNLTIGASGTIQVTITGITDAFVNANDSNGRGHGTGANSSGVYSISVPAGTYTVRAGNPKYGEIGSQSNVVVTAGGTTSVTLSPPTVYTISGTISSATAACKEGASVFFSDRTTGRMAVTTTNSAGSFSIQLPNGNYMEGAAKSGCIDTAAPSSLAVNGANVSTGADRTLTVTDTTISGSVTLSGSNMTRPTKVFATHATSSLFVVTEVNTSATTGNNYTLSLTGGTWNVQARSDGYQSTAASVTVASGGSATQNLTLSAISGYTIADSISSSVKPSRGGIVRNDNIGSKFEVNVPAGSLGTSSDDGSIVTKMKTDVSSTAIATVVGNKAYEITPKNASGQPITELSSASGSITVTIPYTEADVTAAGGSESKLVLGSWDSTKQQWESLATTIDTINNTLTATISHFSDFAPLVPTGGGAPSTPSGLAATTFSQNRVDVSWTATADTTGYYVYRGASSGGSFPLLTTTTATSINNTGLEAGTIYYYKVSSYNNSGESAASSSVNATTQGSSGGGGVAYIPVTVTTTQTPTPTTTTTPTTSSALSAGNLAQAAGDNKIYVIRDGKKLWIPTWDKFTGAGYNLTNVKSSTASALDAYPVATLIRASGDTKVYVIENGAKRHIASEAAFTSKGYKWADVAEIAPTELNLYNTGSQVTVAVPTTPGTIMAAFKVNLRNGEKNDDIKSMQEKLKELGFFPQEQATTNFFGRVTLDAVKKYQTERGLPSTGFVGSLTRAKLNGE